MMRGTFQVDWRRRWRSYNSGLYVDAACFKVAYNEGLNSDPGILTVPSRVRCTIGAGFGWVLVDRAGWARSTRAPTVGSRSAEASFVTCFGVRRSKLERYSHWSSNGSSVARSRKTVVPSLRDLPWSGAAIRLPGPCPGSTSWEGKSRS